MATSAEQLPRLHVVTPVAPPAAVVAAAEAALAGGAPLVQLRTKGGRDRDHWLVALDMAERCRAAGARLVVNDRADVAVAAGADGVHLGADDLPVCAGRAVVGPGRLVGATCRDAASARRAEAEGANYLGVGPAFSTSTKGGLPEALGPRGVARVAAAVDVPVIAIGGVTAERVGPLLEAGAWGVAVCAAVFAAADPRQATEALVEAASWMRGAPA